MKYAKLVTVLLIILNFNHGLCQNPNIKSSDYTVLTKFEQIHGSKKEDGAKEYMSLASYKDHYAILIENVVINDYSVKVKTYDYKNTYLHFTFFYDEKENGKKNTLWDGIKLSACEVQPKSDTKGFVIAFDLSNEYAFDIKGKKLSNIEITVKSGSSSVTTPHGPSSETKDFFIRHKSLIKSKHGSFVDLAKFENKKILLYSLLMKSKGEVSKTLGLPNMKSISTHPIAKYRNDSIYHYENLFGRYEISFKGNIAYYVTFFPIIKIQASKKQSYFTNKYPFELENQNTVDYTLKQGEKTLMYYYPNDIIHKIEIYSKVRFVEKIEAFVYKNDELLTVTKSPKEIFFETIQDTVLTAKEVCQLNNWSYDNTGFAKLRKQFPSFTQNLFWSGYCSDNECKGSILININWQTKNGNNRGLSVKSHTTSEGLTYIANKLSNDLKRKLYNYSPKVYGKYVNCFDTIKATFSEKTISCLCTESGLKFENSEIDNNLKEFILSNSRSYQMQEKELLEIKVIVMQFEKNKYEISSCVTSRQTIGFFEYKDLHKKFIF